MKLKNFLLYGLSLVLVATAAVGGTLAYLTSDDSDVNVMTTGNVQIEQHEYERVVENGEYKTDSTYGFVLKEFTQAKSLLPATALDANGNPYNYGADDYDATRVKMSQVGSHGSMDVFKNKNAIDKFVTVENTGKTDAYVRTIIAMEIGSLTEAEFDNVIKTSSFMTEQGVWKVTDIGIFDIDGNNYYVYEYLYSGAKSLGGVHENGVLPAGDTTYPSLAQVYMTAAATNEDVENIDGNNNGTYDILVLSQAVQVAGFEKAQTALDAAFGKSSEKATEWFGGAKVPAVVDETNIDDALENGKDVVLGDDVDKNANNSNAYGKTAITIHAGQTLDGADNSFKAVGANGTWDSAINATGGTIKNLKLNRGFRGIFVNHNAPADKCGLVTLKNVVIDGPTYTISCDQGTDNGLEAYNCVMNGWTSYAATIGTVKFVDTSFGEGAGYAYCRPYAPTEFVGCDFEAGYVVDARAAVTFENCTIGGVALTADNLATLVISNIQNASVK